MQKGYIPLDMAVVKFWCIISCSCQFVALMRNPHDSDVDPLTPICQLPLTKEIVGICAGKDSY